MRIGSEEGLGAEITIPASMVDSIIDKAVIAATPQVVAIINREKALIGDAAIKTLPFVGGSLAVFLGTFFFVPNDRTVIKVIGYLISAGLLVGGTAMFFSATSRMSSAPATQAASSPSQYTIDFKL